MDSTDLKNLRKTAARDRIRILPHNESDSRNILNQRTPLRYAGGNARSIVETSRVGKVPSAVSDAKLPQVNSGF